MKLTPEMPDGSPYGSPKKNGIRVEKSLPFTNRTPTRYQIWGAATYRKALREYQERAVVLVTIGNHASRKI